MVGLIPLFAVETLEPELLAQVPQFAERLRWFLAYRPDLAQLVVALERTRPRRPALARPARAAHA